MQYFFTFNYSFGTGNLVQFYLFMLLPIDLFVPILLRIVTCLTL